MWQQILGAANDLAALAVVTLVGLLYTTAKELLLAKVSQVKTNTKSDNVAKAMEGIEKICDAVSTSYDPIVEKWKIAQEDGKLTQEEIDGIKNDTRVASYELVDKMLSVETLKSFGLTEDGIKSMIATFVEASVTARRSARLPELEYMTSTIIDPEPPTEEPD